MSISKASKLFILESFVTFQLLFIGTGSIVASEMHPELFGDFSIGIYFGLSIFLGILFFGRISTAHMKPAATFFAFLNKEINFERFMIIFFAQLLGAFLGSYFVSL